MPLAGQPIHQRFVQPGPLVLGSTLLKSPTPTADRDRTVSRRSKPSSRTALMGEQPNPWERLQPQDATSRHRTFSAVFQQRRLYLHPARPKARGRRVVAVMNLPFRHELPPWLQATVVTGSRAAATSTLWSRFRQTSHGIARRIANKMAQVGGSPL